MTYREVAEAILKLPPDKQEQPALIWLVQMSIPDSGILYVKELRVEPSLYSAVAIIPKEFV